MRRLSLVCLSAVCVVLSAPVEHEKTFDDLMSLPADRLVEVNAEQLDQMEIEERALAMELTRQVVETAEMTKKVAELSGRLDEGPWKSDSHVRHGAAPAVENFDGAEVETPKSMDPNEVERTERDLARTAEHVEKLDVKVDTMVEHLKEADVSVKEAAGHSGTMGERTLQLDSQVESLKAQSEELRAGSDELRRAVAKDSGVRRDTALKAVDQLSATLADKIDAVASQADEIKRNVAELKTAAEKVSGKAETAAREIREDKAEASSLAKHMNAHKADALSAVREAEEALRKTDELAAEQLDRTLGRGV